MLDFCRRSSDLLTDLNSLKSLVIDVKLVVSIYFMGHSEIMCIGVMFYMYKQVLNSCVQRKQWEGAFWVLEQLKKQGLQPATTTYGLVMEVVLAPCFVSYGRLYFLRYYVTKLY